MLLAYWEFYYKPSVNSLIPAVKPVMDQLIAQVDFRVSGQLYAAILQSADE